MTGLTDLVIGIKGAGEMASAVAWRLYMANLTRIFMMDIACPLAVRRKVSFCEAILDQHQTVEGVEGVAADDPESVYEAWSRKKIAVAVDPQWQLISVLKPDVCIDAVLAKTNLGTSLTEAPLVIGLGPGFRAPDQVHMVMETRRGHDLGRIITRGTASENTGVPGEINGYSHQRVLRAPQDGLFKACVAIGDSVRAGDPVGDVAGTPVLSKLDGQVRGLIRSDLKVTRGLKLGDVDPRNESTYCHTISDKARAISGSVLEAILRHTLGGGQ